MRGAATRALLLLLLLGGAARAHEAEERRARGLYESGREDYVAQRYAPAYDKFRQAYLLSKAPELLFNMASALERLGRPRDAAEELRAYLRAQPEATTKADIEARIRGLEEAQRIIDAAPPPPAALLSLPERSPARARRRTLAIALGTAGGVVLVGVALGVGLGIGLRPRYPDSLLGAYAATP